MNPTTTLAPFDNRVLRDHFGRFCSGVTIVAGMSADRPVGMAVQAFSAVSLEPPLVLVCPMRTSRSWPAIAESGVFSVNILAEDQEELCAVFGSRSDDKFASVEWTLGAVTGTPILAGTVGAFECRIERTVEAGDHWVVLARIESLASAPGDPLLFDRGSFRRLQPAHDLREQRLDSLITARNTDWWF